MRCPLLVACAAAVLLPLAAGAAEPEPPPEVAIAPPGEAEPEPQIVDHPDEPRQPAPARRSRLLASATVVFPTSPDGFADLGPGLGVSVGGELGLARFASLWARLDCARVLAKGSSASGLTLLASQVGVRFRAPPGRLRPYVDVGGGVAHIRAHDVRLLVQVPPTYESQWSDARVDARTAGAASFGLGLEYPLRSSLAVFADVHLDVAFVTVPPRTSIGPQCHSSDKLCFLSTNQTRFVPIRVGAAFP